MVTAVTAKVQYSLDLEPTLLEQFRTLKQVLAAAVYGYRGGLGAVAVHCDLSPSALSRMLNENEDDPRHLPVDFLPLIVEVTQDLRPVHWLVAKFLPSEEARTRAAVAQLETLAPQIMAALAIINASSSTKPSRDKSR